MMLDHEKSDPAIVAGKSTNKAGQPAAESAEPRVGAEGNASQQSTRRAQAGNAWHRRWNAYDKPQGNERRRGLPRSSTTSISYLSG
jgi:hypothetical protein